MQSLPPYLMGKTFFLLGGNFPFIKFIQPMQFRWCAHSECSPVVADLCKSWKVYTS
jgi:hypothetical protein